MMIIKTILLYIICFISLLLYNVLAIYVENEEKSIIISLIYSIITIIAPLIFVLKYLV